MSTQFVDTAWQSTALSECASRTANINLSALATQFVRFTTLTI